MHPLRTILTVAAVVASAALPSSASAAQGWKLPTLSSELSGLKVSSTATHCGKSKFGSWRFRGRMSAEGKVAHVRWKATVSRDGATHPFTRVRVTGSAPADAKAAIRSILRAQKLRYLAGPPPQLETLLATGERQTRAFSPARTSRCWDDPPVNSTRGATHMSGRFEATVVIDRPIEEVFAFLADGENDPKFSPRVLEIAKTTDGPPGVGTVYASTVKDAGMKTKREFKLTEFDPPARIRWTEISKNVVTAPEGGYDLVREGDGTRVTLYNVLEGHGLGKLIAPLALRSARNGADDFGTSIKAAVEAS